MKNNEITITISGPYLSGKSIVAYLVDEVLENIGFEVDYNDPDTPTHIIRNNLNDKLHELSKDCKITIKQVQTKRTPIASDIADLRDVNYSC